MRGLPPSHPHRPLAFVVATLAALTVAGCQPPVPGPAEAPLSPPDASPDAAAPTAGPTQLAAIAAAEEADLGSINGGPAGGGAALSLPTTAAPDLSIRADVAICAANTRRIPLTGADGQLFAALSRIEVLGDHLYLIADGGLYRISRADAQQGMMQAEPLLLPGAMITGRPVQEIGDLAVDPAAGQVYLLDKVGHIFRYDTAAGRATIYYRAAPDQDTYGDYEPQTVAITVGPNGQVILLDTAQEQLWQVRGFTDLDPVNESRTLGSSLDLTAAGGSYYVLHADGSIWQISQRVGSSRWQDVAGRGLALTLKTTDGGVLVVVDGLARTVSLLPAGQDDPAARYTFSFPGMGLLRDAVLTAEGLYATADAELYVYPAPGSGECAPPNSAAAPPVTLYGANIAAITARFTTPITGMTLPPYPRLYPGASRLYRLGVHRGLDIYWINAPEGFDTGWPVRAIADGVVVFATANYPGMPAARFEALVAQAERLGQSTPDMMLEFLGKQVVIDHGGGVRTVYAHLDSIEPGLTPGTRVRAGEPIGTVGATGTLGESRPGASAPHLHAEIWIGARYLGQGITLRETMWWYNQIFGGTAADG